MVHGIRFHATSRSSTITCSWVVSIREISCVDIINTGSKQGSFINTFFFFLFEVAVTNGYILYKHYTDNSRCKKLKEFHLMLAEQLIGDYCTRHRLGRSGLPIHSLPLRHFPVKLTNESSKHRRGRCDYCSQFRRHRCDSSWYCNECKVWLCHSGDPQSDCFLLRHKTIQ